VPVSSLWARPRNPSARIVRAGEGRRSGGARTLSDEGLRVRELTGPAGGWPEQAETAGGEVMVYVIRGGVELDVSGQVHVLHEGDSLFFDGAMPHRMRGTGDEPARAIYVSA